MKRIRVLLILILCITMMACNKGKEYSKIYKDFKVLKSIGLDCVYEYNQGGYFLFDKIDLKKYDETKTSYINVKNCFFFDEKIACISAYYEVIYYDIENKSILRWLSFQEQNLRKDGSHPYRVVAIKKNDNYDLYIFSYGILYEYNYETGKLIKLYDKFDDLISSIQDGGSVFSTRTNLTGIAPPVYNPLRNSILFSMFDKDENSTWVYIIKELSLEDFTFKEIVKGSRPYVVESKKLLYYIDADGYNIMQMDLDTLENRKILYSYNLPIYYFVTNKSGERIVFIHRNKYPVFDLVNWNFSEYRKSSEILDQRSSDLLYFSKFSDKFTNFPSDLIFPEDFQK